MVRWLAFLFWICSFWTWKAFLVRVFMKAPSRDHLADRGVDEPESTGVSSNGGEADSSSVALYKELSDSLAALPSKILSEKFVGINVFPVITGPLTADDDAFVKESMKAIANSTVLKRLVLRRIWPCTMEGIAEALVSNQSVKRLSIYCVGNEVVESVCRVMLENKCVEFVRMCCRVGNEGAANVSDVLRRNRTLKRLELWNCDMNEEGWKLLLEPLSGGDDSNTVLEEFHFDCGSGVESHCGVHIGNMVRQNTSLPSMGIRFSNEDVATSVVCSIGEALFSNIQLSHLKISLCKFGKGGFNERKDWLNGLWPSLIPDSQGHQANFTLKSLCLEFGFQMGGIDIDFLANMLRKNTSLVEFGCGSALFTEDDVIKLIKALKTKKRFEILNLSYCKGVQGARVLEAIMDLLQNDHLKEIILDGTSLSFDGSAQIIKAELEKKKNRRLLEIV